MHIPAVTERGLDTEMETVLPTDCGNAPRVAIVSEFVTAWASGDLEAVDTRLADDAAWTLFDGEGVEHAAATARVCPGPPARRLEITSVITHGRLAACDGVVDSGAGRIHFSHLFRFASASKTAPIAVVRSYLVTTPSL